MALGLRKALVKVFGWRAVLLIGDPSLWDRYRWLRRNLRKGRSLDAGCGNGGIAMFSASQGNDSVGISNEDSNNGTAAILARAGKYPVQFITGDLRRLDRIKSTGRFDNITCLEVIEHIKDDDKLVKDLAALLASGGRLYLTTPNSKSRMPGEKISKTEDGGHVRRGYTHDELKRLCSRHGLRVIREDFLSGIIVQAIITIMRPLRRISPGLALILTFPLRIFQPLDRPFSSILRWPAMSVAIVAERSTNFKTKRPAAA